MAENIMSTNTERRAFERWISAPPYEKLTHRKAPDATDWPGQYDDYQVQLAWEAWQARARAAAAELGERKEPTDEDLMQFLFDKFHGPIEFLCDSDVEGELMAKSHVRFARAVLARFGGGGVQ